MKSLFLALFIIVFIAIGNPIKDKVEFTECGCVAELNKGNFTLPPEGKIVNVKREVYNGKKIVSIKFEDIAPGGDKIIKGVILDVDGNTLKKKDLNPKAPLVQTKLSNTMKTGFRKKDNEEIKINIALNYDTEPTPETPLSIGKKIDEKGKKSYYLNNKKVDQEQLINLKESFVLRNDSVKSKKRKNIQNAIEKFIKKYQLNNNASVINALDEGRSTITGSFTLEQISRFTKNEDGLIDGIELYEDPTDGMASAMNATRIDKLHDNYGSGSGIGIYMTESGCANAGFRTNYHLIAGNQSDHAENVIGILTEAAPNAFVYCRGGATLPTSTDLNGYNGNPEVFVATRSNGGNNSDDYNTNDRDWDELVYDDLISTYILAHNWDDFVCSPGKGLNVVTVGSYDDLTHAASTFSNWRNPETGNNKPELSAPGEEVTAGGHTMTGTSMATPHAAAIAASIISDEEAWYGYRPHLVKAIMMAGSKDAITGGFNRVGYGGIDAVTAYPVYEEVWEGNNNSFSTFDANDANPNNGYIDYNQFLHSSASNVRVVVAWLNRGTYTYDHRAEAHPIGMDLDVSIYDPNGSYVGGSYSWDNGYEVVEFDPSITGTYRIAINRYANRDSNSNLRLALVVNINDPDECGVVINGNGFEYIHRDVYDIPPEGICIKVNNPDYLHGMMSTVRNRGHNDSVIVEWYGVEDQNQSNCDHHSENLFGNGAQINNVCTPMNTNNDSYLFIRSANSQTYQVDVEIFNWRNGNGCL